MGESNTEKCEEGLKKEMNLNSPAVSPGWLLYPSELSDLELPHQCYSPLQFQLSPFGLGLIFRGHLVPSQDAKCQEVVLVSNLKPVLTK